VMMIAPVVLFAALAIEPPQAAAPACDADPGRRSARMQGHLTKGGTYSASTERGWILRLVPDEQGWLLRVTTKERKAEDLSRLTPPWHSVPNPREIQGWHFRNADNTGPNDGSVNAPQELREFIFSPEVGRGIEYRGSATPREDVERVRAFGRGWLFIESYELTPPRQGQRASFESLTFSACLTWPAGKTP
jgi:hypothetical protein